ncbi:Uma2 family endonuclease [Desulfotomaculum copahuensis]|uniref:Uma2 family endonuclease n=1 Tax=Desulfotomaculum copahuensis TaxID=1838280 RepID=UPI00098F0FD0|nr:Uma2 family endonuclease [Desulfotomaculum copahuensis]
MGGSTHINAAPDMAIEMFSPSTEKYDRNQKSQLYYARGMKEYWLVGPALQLVEIRLIAKERHGNGA